MDKNDLTIVQGDLYTLTLEKIKKRVNEAKYRAFQNANSQLIKMYWDIGKTISIKQETEGWGEWCS